MIKKVFFLEDVWPKIKLLSTAKEIPA